MEAPCTSLSSVETDSLSDSLLTALIFLQAMQILHTQTNLTVGLLRSCSASTSRSVLSSGDGCKEPKLCCYGFELTGSLQRSVAL